MKTAQVSLATLTRYSCGLILAGVVLAVPTQALSQAIPASEVRTLPVQAQPDQTAQTQVAPPLVVEPEIPATTENSLFSLTAIPPRIGENQELKAKPGDTIQTSVRVRNGSNQSIFVNSYVQDFILSEDGQTPIPVQDSVSNRWSLATWMTLSSSTQKLAPQQAGTINVVINVPADALPGGHYAMILHQPSTSPLPLSAGGAAPQTASAVSQRVGTLVYFVVDGPINEAAFIRNFEMPRFTEYGPVPYKFTVENMSDVHIRPQIGIEIYNFFGKQVDTIVVEPKNIFPFIARDFEGQWQRVWGIGPYTAKLTMSYGQSGAVVISKTRFWLLPFKLVLAALTLALSALVIVIAIRRHLIHRSNDDKARIEMLEEKLRQANQNQPPSNTNPEL